MLSLEMTKRYRCAGNATASYMHSVMNLYGGRQRVSKLNKRLSNIRKHLPSCLVQMVDIREVVKWAPRIIVVNKERMFLEWAYKTEFSTYFSPERENIDEAC